MDKLGNIILESKELINDRVEVTHKSAHYFLGPNLTLRDCTIVLQVSARRLFIDSARFIGCTFEVKQELKNYQGWVAASLKGCRFKGRLSGCDFGYWPKVSNLPEGLHGFIEDCDFTEARMDGCRIMGCDPRTLRLPKWPCFTILDPIERAAELCRAPWPEHFGAVVIEDLRTQPAGTRAMIDHAPTLAKRFGTTPEALKPILDTFDCVLS